MEFSWSTFGLEAINFLVLLWLLQRFFYHPVQAMIARRREIIRSTLEQAQVERLETERLKQQLDAREARWAHEREQAMALMQREVAAERARRLDALKADLDTERAKAAVLAERASEAARLELERTARVQGSAFASRLLARLAGPTLEESLIVMATEDMAALPSEHAARLQNTKGPVEVVTAFPLPEARRAMLRQIVEDKFGNKGDWKFIEQRELIAGIRIRIGDLLLQADLYDELSFFADTAHD